MLRAPNRLNILKKNENILYTKHWIILLLKNIAVNASQRFNLIFVNTHIFSLINFKFSSNRRSRDVFHFSRFLFSLSLKWHHSSGRCLHGKCFDIQVKHWKFAFDLILRQKEVIRQKGPFNGVLPYDIFSDSIALVLLRILSSSSHKKIKVCAIRSGCERLSSDYSHQVFWFLNNA